MKLPELKRRFKNKYVIRIAAGVLTIAVAGGSAGVYTVNAAKTSTKAETTQESTDKKDKKDNKDDEEDLKEVLSSKISKAADEEVGKEETVYVVADNSGKAKDVIVSDWLKNPDGNETIEDVSDLKDIKNVKGKEKFKEKDGKITWKAKGKDIYYQGKTDKELPVKQTISYYLDGEKMDPDEIAGKSGKVTIRFDYKNNQKTTTTVDGKKYSVYVPFTIMTGMILDDSFTNVEVKNGKVISDGDKNMVVGVAMPGLKDSLKVTSSDFSEDIDIPEYVEVTADVKDFSMDMTMSVMLSGITSSDNVEDFVDLSDLDDAIDTLSDSSSQLADGTKELREGLEQLRSKVPALADGAKTLNSSTESLRNGVSSLDATLNTAMTEEEKAAASKQASETVDKQAAAIKKQAADMVAAQFADDTNPMGTKQLSTYAAGEFKKALTTADNITTVKNTLIQNQSLTDSVKVSLRETIIATIGESNFVAATGGATDRTAALAHLYDMNANGIQSQVQATLRLPEIIPTYAELEAAVVDSQMNELATKMLGGIAEIAAPKVGASVADAAQKGAVSAAQEAVVTGAKSGAAQGAIAGAESAKKTVAAGIEAVQSNGYSLVTGMDALKNGTQALADQVPALTDGVGKLADGSVTLNEGMVKFDEEGIQKLADTYNGDVKGMLNKVVAVMQAGSDYQSFSDISEDTLGEVKFIIRTEGVGTDED